MRFGSFSSISAHLVLAILLSACGFKMNLSEDDFSWEQDFPLTAPYLLFGQLGFTTNLANQGGTPSLSTLRRPYGLDVYRDILVVADNSNNRVLVRYGLPAADHAGSEQAFAADLVLGQPDASTVTPNTGGRGAGTMNNVSSASTDGQRICAADRVNHRVLLWLSLPTANGQPADIVLGQPDFISGTANNGGVSAKSFSTPNDCRLRGGKLYVADKDNNRILIWNSIPSSHFQAADVVIGQTDFVTGTLAYNPISVPRPYTIAIHGDLLLVASLNDRQIRGWRLSEPLANGPTAQFILGQPDFSGITWTTPASAERILEPVGVATDGTRIAVTDWHQSRILVWNHIPVSNGAPADRVIGQNDFTSTTINSGGLSRSSLANDMLGLVSWRDKLYIIDGGNHRVLTKSWETLE